MGVRDGAPSVPGGQVKENVHAMIVLPLWWRRVGLDFVGGVGEDAAVPVEQVKAALWGWSSRDKRGDRRRTPWRWRTGRLNRRDGEMDDGSSSGEVDEGHRAVGVDDVVREEASSGQR